MIAPSCLAGSKFAYRIGNRLYLKTQNSEFRHFLFNPFDTLSKLLLQIYTYKLKYGLGRQPITDRETPAKTKYLSLAQLLPYYMLQIKIDCLAVVGSC